MAIQAISEEREYIALHQTNQIRFSNAANSLPNRAGHSAFFIERTTFKKVKRKEMDHKKYRKCLALLTKLATCPNSQIPSKVKQYNITIFNIFFKFSAQEMISYYWLPNTPCAQEMQLRPPSREDQYLSRAP